MKRMISLFEGKQHAALYSKFRPTYPENLSSAIIKYYKHVNSYANKSKVNLLLDLGCGNGQATFLFADHCAKISATDPSAEQINLAKERNKYLHITFSTGSAEQLNMAPKSVDIITAGQCAHWWNLPEFFGQAEKVLSLNGLIAIFGYCTPTIEYLGTNNVQLNDNLQVLFSSFYEKCTWHPNRKHVEEKYSDIFSAIPYQSKTRDDSMAIERTWTINELSGYIMSWSGYQAYLKQHKDSPLDQLLKDIHKNWNDKGGETKLRVKWDIFLIMTQIH